MCLGREVVLTNLRSHPVALSPLYRATLFFLLACSATYAQIPYQDQELQVHNLPSLTAKSHDPTDVLLSSLDTILRDPELCCGKDSALVDAASAADARSLKLVAGKLQGRHLLSDGRPIAVTAEYLAPDQVNAGHLIRMILDGHAPLMQWNSHLYVVHGIVFIWSRDEQGGLYAVIRKFLLWDTRYSDSRRDVTFNREIEDASKVQGLMFVQSEAR